MVDDNDGDTGVVDDDDDDEEEEGDAAGPGMHVDAAADSHVNDTNGEEQGNTCTGGGGVGQDGVCVVWDEQAVDKRVLHR